MNEIAESLEIAVQCLKHLRGLRSARAGLLQTEETGPAAPLLLAEDFKTHHLSVRNSGAGPRVLLYDFNKLPVS